MTIKDNELVDLPTPTGLMRTYLFRPQAAGRYPGVIFYSEVFQVTGPVRRIAALIAGHGFVVAVPEIWHEFEAPGRVLPYDQAGADRGNALKKEKELAAIDADARAALDFLKSHPACTGRLGAAGICIGGHLAVRAAVRHPDVSAAVSFYGTDLHGGSFGKGGNDTLTRIGEAKAELLFIWGRQDPHIPKEGRAKIYQALTEAGPNFTWHEFNGQHAFVRDEGPRYDPAAALICHGMMLEFFKRKLGEGDQPA